MSSPPALLRPPRTVFAVLAVGCMLLTLLGRCSGAVPPSPSWTLTTATTSLRLPHNVDADNHVDIVPASFAATATKATSAAAAAAAAAAVQSSAATTSASLPSGAADAMIGSGAAATGSHALANVTFAIRPTPQPLATHPFVTHQAIMSLGLTDDNDPDDATASSTTAAALHPSAAHTHRARHALASSAASASAVKPKPHKRLAAAHALSAVADAIVAPDGEPPLPLGVCQPYAGTTCDMYLRNQSVFVPPHLTIGLLESRLKAAYGVIRESKDMNPNCRGFALPSLCYSILPICRTPEKTNHQYFANKANHEHNAKKSAAAAAKQKKSSAAGSRRAMQLKAATTATTTTTTAAPTTVRSTTTTTEAAPLQLHDELHAEHGTELASRAVPPNRLLPHRRRRRSFDVTIDSRTKSVQNTQHYLHAPSEDFGGSIAGASSGAPSASSASSAAAATAYGQRPFPPTRRTENLRRICRNECELLENELCQKEYAIAKRHPTIGQMLPLEECYDLPDNTDCSKMGIAIDSDENEMCYWENGAGYRGTVDTSASGKPCLQWARLMMDIANYPELAGRNYCRNPGGSEAGPWCFVDNNLGSLEKSIELCAIPRCSDKMWLCVIVAFAGVAAVIVTAVSVCCCKRWRKQAGMSNIQNINLPNVDKNIYGNSRLNSPIEMTSLLHSQAAGNTIQGMQPPTGRNNSALRVTQYTLGDVRFVEELGEGAFGKVYKGELTQQNGDKIYVAVKALKENASAKTQADFKREIELISDLRHDNIVCILGVVLKEEPLCMLFEYMTQGDLHEFLIANSPNEGKSLTLTQFLQISMQICEGMEYLSGHHYVHRDLAARNCLVGGALTVKISDFGLSRDIYSSDYYRVQSKSLLPVRWMPSESILYGKFTTESDVWSYGVVLWEIYSYGLQPYYGYSNQEVISMVRARQLLPCPEVCPSAVYTLMVECWHEQAVRRPSFPEIGHRLKIWYQAQKRNDQTENASLCPSRKGSTFSVLSSNRPPPAPATSITPSTSTHQLSGGPSGSNGLSSNSNTLGRDRDHHHQHQHSHHHQQQATSHSHHHHHHHHHKEAGSGAPVTPKERYGANHHSLDREKVRLVHQQQLSAASSPSVSQHHQHHQHHQPQQLSSTAHGQHQQQHHHHHHHRSLDRDSSSNSSKSAASNGQPPSTSAAVRFGNNSSPLGAIGGGGALPKSRSSNNSLSSIAASTAPSVASQHHYPQQQAPLLNGGDHANAESSPQHHRRSSQFDVASGSGGCGEEAAGGALPPPHQSRSNSRSSVHRPPKDPSKAAGGSGHHHHHHHHGGGGHHHHSSGSSSAGSGHGHHDGAAVQRKKSINLGGDVTAAEGPVLNGGGGGVGDVRGHRKLSAAGSVSSMHSEASAVSGYSHHSRQQQPPQHVVDAMLGPASVGPRAS